MQTDLPSPTGLWLPLVTPFRDGVLDEASVRRLVRHYASEPIDGLILAATTGEGLTLDEDETERLVALVTAELGATGRSLPVYLGLSGSDTRKLVRGGGATRRRGRSTATSSPAPTTPGRPRRGWCGTSPCWPRRPRDRS